MKSLPKPQNNWTGITEGTDLSYSSDRVNYIWLGCYTQYCIVSIMWQITLPLGAGPQEWGTEEWHLWWIFIPHSLHWRPCLKNPQIKLPQWSHQVGLLKLVLLKQCDSSIVSSFWSLWTGLFRSSISTIYSTDKKYLSEGKHTVPVGFELIHKLAEIAMYLFLIFCTDFFNWWMHALIRLWH